MSYELFVSGLFRHIVSGNRVTFKIVNLTMSSNWFAFTVGHVNFPIFDSFYEVKYSLVNFSQNFWYWSLGSATITLCKISVKVKGKKKSLSKKSDRSIILLPF